MTTALTKTIRSSAVNDDADGDQFLVEDGSFDIALTKIEIRRPSSRTATPVPPAPIREPSVSDLVHLALAQTGYPLQNIRCWCDDQTVTLSGCVTRYFYIQIAVEAARAFANGRRIDARIDVVPASKPGLSAG